MFIYIYSYLGNTVPVQYISHMAGRYTFSNPSYSDINKTDHAIIIKIIDLWINFSLIVLNLRYIKLNSVVDGHGLVWSCTYILASLLHDTYVASYLQYMVLGPSDIYCMHFYSILQLELRLNPLNCLRFSSTI